MKVIIAGSRVISDYSVLLKVMSNPPFQITELVSGGAPGVDKLGEQYAEEHHIPVHLFLADWQGYGKRAGMIRNSRMAVYADALIALWDGESKGTKHMILCMEKLKKPSKIVYCNYIVR